MKHWTSKINVTTFLKPSKTSDKFFISSPPAAESTRRHPRGARSRKKKKRQWGFNRENEYWALGHECDTTLISSDSMTGRSMRESVQIIHRSYQTFSRYSRNQLRAALASSFLNCRRFREKPPASIAKNFSVFFKLFFQTSI